MYGDVHLAINNKNNKRYAIKIVTKATFNKMPMLEKLTRNELSVLKNTKNPNIIKFIEIIR